MSGLIQRLRDLETRWRQWPGDISGEGLNLAADELAAVLDTEGDRQEPATKSAMEVMRAGEDYVVVQRKELAIWPANLNTGTDKDRPEPWVSPATGEVCVEDDYAAPKAEGDPQTPPKDRP